MIINQQIITITRNLNIVEKTIKFPPPGTQILFVIFVGREATKDLKVKIKGTEIFVIIYKPILKAKPISLLKICYCFGQE